MSKSVVAAGAGTGVHTDVGSGGPVRTEPGAGTGALERGAGVLGWVTGVGGDDVDGGDERDQLRLEFGGLVGEAFGDSPSVADGGYDALEVMLARSVH